MTRDQEHAKARKQRDTFEARARESEATLDWTLNDLTEANKEKDAWLSSSLLLKPKRQCWRLI
jgi:hypothetical protein